MVITFPILVSGFIMLLSQTQAHPRWKTVTTTPDFTVAYDSASVMSASPHVHYVTTRWRYLRPSSIAGHFWTDGVRSLITRYVLDCGLNRSKVLEVTAFDASGRILKTAAPPPVWYAILRQEPADLWARELCTRTDITSKR